MQNNKFIITGGPGSGKTTLIKELKTRGFFCVDEVARKIIQEQIKIDGDALPWGNIEKFKAIMLEKTIETYTKASFQKEAIIFFDRGVLDIVAYSHLTKTAISFDLQMAAKTLAYHKKVFFAPAWEDIFCNDSERKQSFQEALDTQDALLKVYSNSLHEVITLPKTSVEERADFILSHINYQAKE